jgi:FKBP-type peptidyl-prolyl cis-trans isomerase FkpA
MNSDMKNKLLNKKTLLVAAGVAVAFFVLHGRGGGKLFKASQPDDVTFEVLTQGSGAVAEKGQNVYVRYTTYLKEGMKQVDSSLNRKDPDFVFRLGSGQVVPGWDKGVTGMRVGEKRRIDVPSKLGYGEKGAGTIVPPNSELIYETELTKLEEYTPPAQAQQPAPQQSQAAKKVAAVAAPQQQQAKAAPQAPQKKK